MLPAGEVETVNTSMASLVEELDDTHAQAKLLELRIHAHRLTARELLEEEGTESEREIAARLIRGADLLEADLMMVREQQRRLVERAARMHGPRGSAKTI